MKIFPELIIMLSDCSSSQFERIKNKKKGAFIAP
jgi:hypothetical protein